MRRKARTGISIEEHNDLWGRWKDGQSMQKIAEALERRVVWVCTVVHMRGGVAPPPRRRAPGTLTLAEREEISLGICKGRSMREMARRLGRAASTISREISRHGGAYKYRATVANVHAERLTRRPKPCLLSTHPQLRRIVGEKLANDWSPQQISEWLKVEYARDRTMRISHETIYRSLFIQTRGVLKRELLKHLRRRRKVRNANNSYKCRQVQKQLSEEFSISKRPADVEDRAIPGHWEGDLLCGNKRSQIATLVERKSRFVILVKTPTKETDEVVRALARHFRKLPMHLCRSLTWDRGFELKNHKKFTMATDMQVYLCDPHSPWQRGSNENTNGLLRQYFPKGEDVSGYTQTDLDQIALKLNQRPRKTLGYRTPADTLAAAVASTD